VLTVLALAVLTLAAAWSVRGAANARWARNTALPEIKRLVAQDNYVAAFALAKSAEPFVSGDAEFASLWPKLSVTRSVTSNPSGAAVYVRDVALRSDWQLLGYTPLDRIRIPAAVCRWKFDKPGFEGRQFIATPVGPWAVPAAFDLTPAGSLPPDMVKVPAGPLQLTLTGFDYNKMIPSDQFLIDKFEVTNKAFKEFVDGGGYEKREYWKQPFVKDGHPLTWDEAMAAFRDQTGRPGPSTWEVGAYPQGQETYPVGGVSWYEAAAYAEFTGKSLPTIYHWLRAAGTQGAADITPLSNFGKHSARPVGQSPAVTWVGVSDMAGNVKEWCWNEMEPAGNRYILGGAWDEPDYMFIYPDARSPFDRSATNGIRLVKYLKPESAPAATLALIEKPTRNYANEKPASDEVFRAYKSLYAYDPAPLDSKLERVEDSSDKWRKEKLSFSAAYGQERVPAFLFLPKNTKPPFQTVLYWPGSGAVRARSSDSLPDAAAIEFLVVSGRAVLYPVYYGTYERNSGRDSTWPEMTHAYHDWVLKQVNDARRSLDYLATRADVRQAAIGYFGISWGSRMSPVVLGQDSRIRAAVLASGGFSPGKAPPEVDPFNFAPRVTVPVLMINGDRDFIFDVQISQNPLFEVLGTPSDRKRHLVLEAGHGVFIEKRSQMIREALDWFDRYLGPVQ